MDRVLRRPAQYLIIGLLLSSPSLAESQGNGLPSVSGKDGLTPPAGSDSGTNDEIFSTAVFDDGSSPALYAGGLFTTADEISAHRIAKWDGTTWSALDRGLSGGVFALTIFDDGRGPALYAGGIFTLAGDNRAPHIARWDGARWSALGSRRLNNAVFAVTVFNDGNGPALYVGGMFGTADEVVHTNAIAKWDGTTWSALDRGMSLADTVYALTVFNDGSGSALYVGGTFTTAGGSAANNVAKWDGTSWSAVGHEMQAVNSLTVFDDGDGPALYAGGDFRLSNGVFIQAVTKWDGTRWSVVGRVMDERPLGSVDYLSVFDHGNGPVLYAGGTFTTIDGVRAHNIAKWDGTTWSALGRGADNGLSGGVNTSTVFDDGSGPALYVGGGFTAAGRVRAHYIARWDGTSWSALGRGTK